MLFNIRWFYSYFVSHVETVIGRVEEDLEFITVLLDERTHTCVQDEFRELNKSSGNTILNLCNIYLIYFLYYATFLYTVKCLFIMIDISIVSKWQLIVIFIKVRKWFFRWPVWSCWYQYCLQLCFKIILTSSFNYIHRGIYEYLTIQF